MVGVWLLGQKKIAIDRRVAAFLLRCVRAGQAARLVQVGPTRCPLLKMEGRVLRVQVRSMSRFPLTDPRHLNGALALAYCNRSIHAVESLAWLGGWQTRGRERKDILAVPASASASGGGSGR